MCSISGCNSIVLARGFCKKHYLRWYRTGNPEIVSKIFDGRKSHPAWKTWHEMKARCTNKNHKFYHRYGGRGIKICDRWVNDFWAFVQDVWPKPEKCSLDRINNDGNYEPGNVRWATTQQQTQNTSVFKRTPEIVEKVLSFKRKAANGRGDGLTYAEIAKVVGNISSHTVGEIFRNLK
jgi:hypothetical protein